MLALPSLWIDLRDSYVLSPVLGYGVLCVVYTVMPSKATLFNCKCEVVFDYGTGHRNMASFNAQGSNILMNYLCACAV